MSTHDLSRTLEVRELREDSELGEALLPAERAGRAAARARLVTVPAGHAAPSHP